MPKGKIMMYRENGGYGFIKPDDAGNIVPGTPVTCEIGGVTARASRS